jgi:glycosyltransferase involved in cell wall biosynthesis
MLKDVAPEIPVATHCHATGLRQMDLCPHLTDEVRDGCRRNDRILVLRQGHALEIGRRLDIAADRIHAIGTGYRQDLFHPRGRVPSTKRIVYAGKYSNSKGVPWLLEALRRLRAANRHIELHIAGSGSGAEAEQISKQIAAMEGVTVHGRLDQRELANLLRTAAVFVLPSFYEGVPLVLVEAAACGCRVVATDLPGVREELAPALGKAINLVPLPTLRSVDQPEPADLPHFVDNLAIAIEGSLHEASGDLTNHAIEKIESQFSWSAVFRRIEEVWFQLSGTMPARR